MVVNAPFSRAVLAACLSVFGALCFVVAFLLAVLLVTSMARGDGANPVAIALAAVVFAIAGVCSRWASKKFA
jgi:hypothetical protein